MQNYLEHNASPIFFSIIIPTYNRADFIEKTILSVLNQTYQNFEIIVVDDGSTDHTQEVINSIISDKIKIFKVSNGERAKARNFGIQQAKGHYITFLDSDDLFYPLHLQEAVQLINKYPNIDFFHLAYEIITPEGKVLTKNNHRKGDLGKQLLKGNHLSCIGVFVKNEVIKQHLFNEYRNLSGTEDWELWMRLASRYKLYYNNEISAAIVNHENRSVLNIEEDNLLKRINLAVAYLCEDKAFIEVFGKSTHILWAHLWLYVSLHLILGKSKKRGFYYWFKAFTTDPTIIFTRKTFSIWLKLLI